MHRIFFGDMEMFILITILKHYAKPSVLTFIESDS